MPSKTQSRSKPKDRLKHELASLQNSIEKHEEGGTEPGIPAYHPIPAFRQRFGPLTIKPLKVNSWLLPPL